MVSLSLCLRETEALRIQIKAEIVAGGGGDKSILGSEMNIVTMIIQPLIVVESMWYEEMRIL